MNALTDLERYFRYIPKRKRAAVKDFYHDQDGYWIILSPGWKVRDYAADGVIHEDTLRELLTVFKRVY